MSTIKTALIQQKAVAEPAENLAIMVKSIEEAAQNGAQLIVLQELHNSFYFPQQEDYENYKLVEPIPGPSTKILGDVAKRTGTVIVGSLFEERAKGVYHNTAVVMERDGTLAGRYRKMHIPDDPGFYEKFYFIPGDLGFTPIQTSLGKLGVLVCWDQWFPEAARLMALAGADLLIYPTAIGWHPADPADEKKRQLDAWTTIQRSHAVANGIPVLSVNRVGYENNPYHPEVHEKGIQFWGNSFVAGPQGEILAQADNETPTHLYATLDLERTRTVRQMWPYLRDRRIDSYEGLLQRYID